MLQLHDGTVILVRKTNGPDNIKILESQNNYILKYCREKDWVCSFRDVSESDYYIIFGTVYDYDCRFRIQIERSRFEVIINITNLSSKRGNGNKILYVLIGRAADWTTGLYFLYAGLTVDNQDVILTKMFTMLNIDVMDVASKLGELPWPWAPTHQ